MSSTSYPQPPWSSLPPPGMGCDDRGLVMGAGTRLVRMNEGRFAVEEDSDRCIALLSVLCRKPVGQELLRPIEAAAAYWAAGDKALANLRLVFSGLPSVASGADADRLTAAAWCLDQGLAPRELMNALGLDPSVLDLRKYDPDQPRVPAGSGRESGQWTGDEAINGASGRPKSNTTSFPNILLAATTTNFDYACKKLGLDPNAASDALHDAKSHARLGGADNCVFDLETGDIFFRGEHIGNLGD